MKANEVDCHRAAVQGHRNKKLRKSLTVTVVYFQHHCIKRGVEIQN